MDLVAALTGFFAAASIVWILLGLFIALVLGTLMASFFVSLFYGLSRLARAAEAACSPDGKLRRPRGAGW
jgi:hypothetical protein